MTICICGHSFRDHFQGGKCSCSCPIYDPDTTGKERGFPGKQVEMRLPDPPCEMCRVDPCECDDRRDLR